MDQLSQVGNLEAAMKLVREAAAAATAVASDPPPGRVPEGGAHMGHAGALSLLQGVGQALQVNRDYLNG